jgi:type VI secretion system protein VasG
MPVLSDTVLSAMAEGRTLSGLLVEPGEGGDWKITTTESGS